MTTLSQPKSQVLTVNGLRLHYLDWGNAGAPAVVCVHGYGSSADAFSALARHFQGSLHCIAPDVRGRGESDWSPTGAYQYSDMVSDLEGLVDQRRVEQGAPPRPALWPVLERLACPTLVVWGMESDVLSEAQARRMAEVLPRGELVAVPGVGHAPTLMEPVALAALERLFSELS